MPPILHPKRLPSPFPSSCLCFYGHTLRRGALYLLSLLPPSPSQASLHIPRGWVKRKKMDSSLEAEIDRLSRPPGEADPSEPSTGTVPTTILQPQNGRLAGGDGDYPVMVPQVPGAQQPRLSRGSSGSSSGGNLRPRGSGGLTSAGDET